MSKEIQFTNVMTRNYEYVRDQFKYNATAFFHQLGLSIQKHGFGGGVHYAQDLLATRNEQTGFTRLWMIEKSDPQSKAITLSVEYTALMPEWQELFEPDHLEEARRRLVNIDYVDIPPIR